MTINPALTTKYPAIFGSLDPSAKWQKVRIPFMHAGNLVGKEDEWVVNTLTGEIYIPDDKATIWAKMVGIALIRIPMTIAKTLYHMALPVSLALAIDDGVDESRGKPLKEIGYHCLTKCGQNLVDIVKTPLVGLALTVLFVAGAILGPLLCTTDFLYETRSAISSMIHFLWWNGNYMGFESPCMTSRNLLKEDGRKFIPCDMITYPEEYNDDEKRLLHLIARYHGFKRPPDPLPLQVPPSTDACACTA